MNDIITPESLNSYLYDVRCSPNDRVEILYVDFKFDPTPQTVPNRFSFGGVQLPNVQQYGSVIGPDIFTKTVRMGEIEFEKKDGTIKDMLDMLFVTKALELGNKNRNSIFNLKEMRKRKLQEIVSGKFDENPLDICNMNDAPTKINNAKNFIATNGRIGAGQYIILNKKTFDYMVEHMPEPITIHYIVNENVPDNTLVMGRKNTVDQPGLSTILIAKDNEIVYTCVDDTITIKCTITDIGFFPERQFYTLYLKTTSSV